MLGLVTQCLISFFRHPAHQRRVGGVFMRHAPKLKELYTAYCANHPRAVAILQKNRYELKKE